VHGGARDAVAVVEWPLLAANNVSAASVVCFMGAMHFSAGIGIAHVGDVCSKMGIVRALNDFQ